MKPVRAGVVFLLCLTLASPASAKDAVYDCAGREKCVALTFDDGPHPTETEEILSILDEYGVKATFFLIGENAERWPELVEKEIRAGHEIGNHSYSHPDLSKADYETVCREIDEAERAVWENSEFRTRLFRPPGGCFGEAVVRAAKERDYTLVCWSVDTRDWAHTPTDQIVRNVMTNAEGGDILLFHDSIAGDTPTPQALRIILPRLIGEGYRFVTVSELLREE
ncbi:MAG: polysaccharide deacetylase family protein [Clostridia bacterium]|nr:polysaccharide deacetylase family protein [Clostridia bacterium]